MRIIIVGASGLIGSALQTVAVNAGHQVVGTYAGRPREGLVRFDVIQESLADAVHDLGPDDSVVFLAGMIDQAWVQDNPGPSRAINVNGAIACAAAAFLRRAHFVYLSSEAIFGAGDERGFDETGTPAPLSLYAKQKVEVENALFLMQGRWCIVRCGSIIGWGSQDRRDSVSLTYQSLLRPNAKMANDNLFTITDVFDVAYGLLRIAADKVRGGIHLAANPPVARAVLADWIIRQSKLGSQMSYERVSFEDLGTNGLRAQRAWLRNKHAIKLGYKFSEPRKIAERKVELLDNG